MTKLNFENKLQSMEKVMNIWTSRELSLKGKVTIVKSIVLPQIGHLLSMCYCPKSILEHVNKMLFRFLWNKKPPKIKKETVIANFKDGGLRMPDIFAHHANAKIGWVKRLNADEDAKWSKLMWYMLNIDKHLLNHKFSIVYCNKSLSQFHKQILECWQHVKCRPPESIEEIYQEYLFDNMFICSNNKPLDYQHFKLCKDKSKDIMIKSLFNNTGGQITYQELNQRLNWNISIYSYNLIYAAIPRNWKQKLKGWSPTMNMYNKVYLRIKGSLIDLNKISNKDTYYKLLENIIEEPTSIATWVDLFPFLDNIQWENIFLNVHHMIAETYLQTFQYKILHRLTNCNYNLFKWKLKDSPYCNYCSIHIDTIEHHFYLCGFCKQFWEQLGKYLTRTLSLENSLDLTICEVIFGIGLKRNQEPTHIILNIVTLFGKWYINSCRRNEKKLSFLEFINMLKHKMHIYKNICSKAVRGVKKQIFDLLNTIKWDN